jgi:hypothetical protein
VVGLAVNDDDDESDSVGEEEIVAETDGVDEMDMEALMDTLSDAVEETEGEGVGESEIDGDEEGDTEIVGVVLGQNLGSCKKYEVQKKLKQETFVRLFLLLLNWLWFVVTHSFGKSGQVSLGRSEQPVCQTRKKNTHTHTQITSTSEEILQPKKS